MQTLQYSIPLNQVDLYLKLLFSINSMSLDLIEVVSYSSWVLNHEISKLNRKTVR